MFGTWLAVTEAYNSAMLARESVRAAAEMRAITQSQDVAMGIAALTDPKLRLHPGDCASCGSQEFRHWHGRSVCAYCRSVADAPAARQTPIYDRYVDRWMRARVCVPVIRPHAHARLTID